MQTIYTKILPFTETKPTRIKAMHEGGVVTVTIPRGEGSIEQAFCSAAMQLKIKLHWHGKMQGGHHKDGMIFVFSDDRYSIPSTGRNPN